MYEENVYQFVSPFDHYMLIAANSEEAAKELAYRGSMGWVFVSKFPDLHYAGDVSTPKIIY